MAPETRTASDESRRRGTEPWAAAFVLYHPDPAVVERNVSVVRSLGGGVLLVDNTPEPAVDSLWASERGAELLFNGNRDGIAGALEEAFLWAEGKGLPWLLTMDQDSEVRGEWLRPLLRKRDDLPDDAAVLSAEHVVDAETDGTECSGEPFLQRKRDVMTSGNLVRTAAWKAVGGFDRSLFIDQVDHDFCLRLGRAGFSVWRLAGAKMRHPLGEARRVRFFGRNQLVLSHGAFRWRTIARNIPRVAFRHLAFSPSFARREFYNFAKMFVLMLLFEDDRPEKVRAAARGFLDFLLGRTGAPR